MKKIVFGILITLFLFSAAFAAQGEQMGANEEAGNEPVDISTQNAGETQQIRVQERAGDMQTFEQLREQNREMFAEEAAGKQGAEAKAYRNQNQVRTAVQSLLAMEDIVGGIGPQVSAIAREWNNGIDKSLEVESRIQQRSGFARFFTGGNSENGEALEAIVNKNQERIQELKQLRQQCQADEETCNAFEEQIKVMEKEQERLGKLAQKEKGNGLFGWLWK